MSQMAEIRVPTLGESVTEATIGKWFKKPGDPVAVDEPVVELETDKVTIEVPAPAGGDRARGRGADARRAARGRRAGARAVTDRCCGTRGARAHDAAAPDHRAASQGCAEHRRHAHDLQRGRHERGDAPARPIP